MDIFQTGDVVKYVGKDTTFWRSGKEHIIYESSYMGDGIFEYSTNRGAWFSHNDFELVRRADKESLAQLDKDLEDELGEV